MSRYDKTYSLVQYEGSETCGVAETDKHGGNHIRNHKDLLTALESLASILTGPRCRECSGPQVFGWYENVEREMRERGLCFECRFWAHRAADSDQNSVVVNGWRYDIEPDVPKGYRGSVGHGGAKFVIRFHDGREVVSHNLWSRGEVPSWFRDRLPDNAEFVSRGRGDYTGVGSAASF